MDLLPLGLYSFSSLGDDGGDRRFVDQVLYALVDHQHGEIIVGFDDAPLLEPVDQEERHRDVVHPGRVQKGVLQKGFVVRCHKCDPPFI